eukprot:COSAG06_NODE_44710_length_361_cov_0.786260_1_plen_68_part_01
MTRDRTTQTRGRVGGGRVGGAAGLCVAPRMAAAGPAATATAAATPSFSDLLLVGEVGRRWVATQRERG